MPKVIVFYQKNLSFNSINFLIKNELKKLNKMPFQLKIIFDYNVNCAYEGLKQPTPLTNLKNMCINFTGHLKADLKLIKTFK